MSFECDCVVDNSNPSSLWAQSTFDLSYYTGKLSRSALFSAVHNVLPRNTFPVSFLSRGAFSVWSKALQFATISKFCVVLVLLALLGGGNISYCSAAAISGSPVSSPAECPVPGCLDVGTFLPANYFDTSYPYLASFSVVYFPSYKLLSDNFTGQTFVLWLCGTQPPAKSLYPGSKFFKIPLQTVAVDETIAAGFLELLGLRENIKYMDTTYESSDCLIKLAAQGRIGRFESQWGNSTLRSLQVASVDAYFSGNNANPDDPKAIPYAASIDPGTLNRAEWLKFISYFFNKEAAAAEIYNGIYNRYNALKSIAARAEKRPKVAWVQYASWSDPEPTLQISQAPYKLQFVADAGGINPDFGVVSFNAAKNHSDFLAALSSEGVDIIIDETYYPSPDNTDLATMMASLFLDPADLHSSSSAHKFLSEAQIWRNDGRISLKDGFYADDWFEEAEVQVDAVLYDLLRVLQPELHSQVFSAEFSANLPAPQILRSRLWFRNVAQEEGIAADSFSHCVLPQQLRMGEIPMLAPAQESYICPVKSAGNLVFEAPKTKELPDYAVAIITVGSVAVCALVAALAHFFKINKAVTAQYQALKSSLGDKTLPLQHEKTDCSVVCRRVSDVELAVNFHHGN
jgi:hypothetical protein